jgi:hypothetical protein
MVEQTAGSYSELIKTGDRLARNSSHIKPVERQDDRIIRHTQSSLALDDYTCRHYVK